jgi:ABC-type transporter Mla subunit MlaD
MSDEPDGQTRRDPIADLLSALAAPLGQLISQLNLDQLREATSGASDLVSTLTRIQSTLSQLEQTARALNTQLEGIAELLTAQENSPRR